MGLTDIKSNSELHKKQLDEENLKLIQKINLLENEVYTVCDQNEVVKDMYEECQMELLAENSNIRTELDTSLQKIIDLESQTIKLSDEIVTIQNEHEKLKALHKDVEQQNHDLESENFKLKDQLSSVKQNLIEPENQALVSTDEESEK